METLTTEEVAELLNRAISTVCKYAKATGIVYKKHTAHAYTMEEVEKIRRLLPALRPQDIKRKQKKVELVDDGEWIDPTPRSLQDDYEDEEWIRKY